jgi:hypothetical protein
MMQPSTLASDGPVRAKSLHMSDTYSLLRSAGFRRYNRQTNLLSTCERAEATILLALRTTIAHVFGNAQERAAGAAPHSPPRRIGESPAEFSMGGSVLPAVTWVFVVGVFLWRLAREVGEQSPTWATAHHGE